MQRSMKPRMITFPIIIYIASLCIQTNGFIAPIHPAAVLPSSDVSGARPRWESFAQGSNDWIIDDDDYSSTNEDKPRSKSQTAHHESSKKDRQRHDSYYVIDEDTRQYFATCIPGLHETLSSELDYLGATNIGTQGLSGVSFTGSPEIGLRCLLWCRTVHRLMELVCSSDDNQNMYDDGFNQDFNGIRNSQELYDFTKNAVHTPSLLGNGKGGLLTLSVSTIYTSKVPKDLCHSHYTALTVKNALVDSVRDLREDGVRPDVDTVDADVPLVVVLRGRRAYDRARSSRDRRRDTRDYNPVEDEEDLIADVDIYRSLHCGSLHRRGYRTNNDSDSTNSAPIHRAAMKESLASGLLLQSGWDKLITTAKSDNLGAILVDPMTGSATLPIEAALIACDLAPGLSRIASFKGKGRNMHRFPPAVRWKDFATEETWESLLKEATKRFKSGVDWAQSNVEIYCNEKNSRAVSLAEASIKNSGVGSIISLSEGDCLDWNLNNKVRPGRTIFVCNPPWGLRLTQDIDDSWVSLREFLRRDAGGAEAWVLSGNKEFTKLLRMKTSRKVVVRTAEEDLRWLQYHVFERKDVPVVVEEVT